MLNFIKRIIRKSFNFAGFDVVRLRKNQEISLWGLKQLPIKTIIDVGANEGQFAKMVSKVFPDAKIHCFEPIPEAYKKLQDWAKSQQNITTYNYAIGEKEGALEMFQHIKHSPSSSLLKTTNTCEKIYPFTKSQVSTRVNMTTLDRWFFELTEPLMPEILIKLDVQGYEDRVIKGGKEVFQRAKACIMEICLDKLYEEQATFYELCSLLYDLGYCYSGNLSQTYAEDGHVIYIDAVFVK